MRAVWDSDDEKKEVVARWTLKITVHQRRICKKDKMSRACEEEATEGPQHTSSNLNFGFCIWDDVKDNSTVKSLRSALLYWI